jgi:hypothetical protein
MGGVRGFSDKKNGGFGRLEKMEANFNDHLRKTFYASEA